MTDDKPTDDVKITTKGGNVIDLPKAVIVGIIIAAGSAFMGHCTTTSAAASPDIAAKLDKLSADVKDNHDKLSADIKDLSDKQNQMHDDLQLLKIQIIQDNKK